MSGGGSTEFEEQVHKAQQRYRLPPGAREILLIRHGSSVGATSDTVRIGPLTMSDPVLTEEGREQAEALARHLATQPLAAIFVTPLRRTQQTAAPLAESRGITPTILPELHEVYLGDWEHEFYERAASGDPLLARMFAEQRWDVIPNAESSAAVAARGRAGIEAIVAAIPVGATAAAFSHAGTIADLCREATGSRPFAFTAPENSSVSRLVVTADGNWKLRSFNDMGHLGYC